MKLMQFIPVSKKFRVSGFLLSHFLKITCSFQQEKRKYQMSNRWQGDITETSNSKNNSLGKVTTNFCFTAKRNINIKEHNKNKFAC